jgi:DME family drug/metabolite transporter
VLAALGAGACFAFTADVGAPLSRRVDAVTITTGIMNVAALVLVPCALLVALVGQVTYAAPPGAWLLVGLLSAGVVATNALMFAGLRRTSSTAAVVATLIEPVTAVVIAAVFLGEHLTSAGTVGCVLILTAIASLGRFDDQEPHPETHVTPTPL